MFLFWYRFVRPNLSAIARDAGAAIYENIVKPQLADFMGKIFEEICIQYLFQPEIYATNPFPIGNVGKWWGTNPFSKIQEEIDIVALYDDNVILGECKWRNQPVDTGMIQKLLERGQLFPYFQKYFYIFSKTGFTDSARELGLQHNIRMICFEDMNQPAPTL